MRIVFAEDQEVSRFFLSSHLRAMGHTVMEAANGKEAVALFERDVASSGEAVGMLITDWDMPAMNGLELAKKAREIMGNRPLYVILLTGKGDAYDKITGFAEGGVDDYVTKPFEIDELKLRIQVGVRLIEAEQALLEYSHDLEGIVRRQTMDIRDSQAEIIVRLFNALQSRNAETGDHVARIGVMSAHLAGLMNWSTEHIDLIRGAAPLHDVGKIGISDAILLKPGPLDVSERSIMQQHTIIGADILSGSHSSFIQMAERIALCHHENWDGTGYPRGLKGKDIPIEARIVSLVDVYDALRSDRVYRPAIDEPLVITFMQQNRGKKFDPDMLDIFMENLVDIHDAVQRFESQGGDTLRFCLAPYQM